MIATRRERDATTRGPTHDAATHDTATSEKRSRRSLAMAMAVPSVAATIFTTRASTRMRMRAGDDQAGARSQRRRRRRGDSATRPRCRAARRGVPRHGRSGRFPASAARLGSAARRGLAPRGAAAQCPASAARLGVAVAARRGDSTAPRGTAARQGRRIRIWGPPNTNLGACISPFSL